MTTQTIRRFRDFASLPFEAFIVIFTLLPILVLGYFYSALPERIPEYLTLRGAVAVWGQKGIASVFRLPLMALDLQIICLLSKYGIWQSHRAPAMEIGESLKANFNLLDWFRTFIAIKLAASSLEVVFYSVERFQFLTTFTRTTSWVASALGIVGAAFLGYRLVMLNRKFPSKPAGSQSHGGIFYYNSQDPSWFTDKYLPNFGNKWVYVFLACLLSLPLLMFWPLLIR